MTVLFGIFTHAIGGASSASFYIPSSGQRPWSHETYWLIHMTFLILFSKLWSLALGEWKGAPDGARVKLTIGITILIAAIAMIGFSHFLLAGATPK